MRHGVSHTLAKCCAVFCAVPHHPPHSHTRRHCCVTHPHTHTLHTPGALENLDVLRGLTSLSLSRAQQPRSLVLTGGARLPDLLQMEDQVAAELEDLQYRAAAQAAGPPGEEAAPGDAPGVPPGDALQPAAAAAGGAGAGPQQQEMFGLAAAGELGGAPDLLQVAAAAAAAPVAAGASSSSSRSSGSGRRSSSSGRSAYDSPSLPACLSKMDTLRELRLDNMVPCYTTLAPLKHLEALELRVSAGDGG